jgi:CBS domain-containing protein
MHVEDLMSADVLTVDEAMPVGPLLDLMTAAHVQAVPVVGVDGELVGIVSQEDILVGGLGLGRGDGPDDLTVGDIMTAPAMSVTREASLDSVARMMWQFRIHHVPVIDEQQGVIGIVSALDFCRHAAGLSRDDPEGAGEDVD